MPMILLVLDHIQINVLNIHNPQGSAAGHQIMKSPSSSFSRVYEIFMIKDEWNLSKCSEYGGS